MHLIPCLTITSDTYSTCYVPNMINMSVTCIEIRENIEIKNYKIRLIIIFMLCIINICSRDSFQRTWRILATYKAQ